MDAKSQSKVIAAGFKIIRADDQPNIRIKCKDSTSSDWHTLKKFETKAARDRKMAQLLNLQMVITD